MHGLRTARARAAAVFLDDGRAGPRRPDHLLRSNKRDEKLPKLRETVAGRHRGTQPASQGPGPKNQAFT
eukprot:507804-Prymnesium_polylepis.1